MASWETQTRTSGFDAMSFTTNQISGREGSRQKASGGVRRGGYKIVGMDVTKVGPAIEALNTYVTNIEKYVEGLEATATSSQAFKSEVVTAAVKKYIEKVETYCINLCSQLRAFGDKLKDAQAQWEESMRSFADSINTSESQLDAGTKYTASGR